MNNLYINFCASSPLVISDSGKNIFFANKNPVKTQNYIINFGTPITNTNIFGFQNSNLFVNPQLNQNMFFGMNSWMPEYNNPFIQNLSRNIFGNIVNNQPQLTNYNIFQNPVYNNTNRITNIFTQPTVTKSEYISSTNTTKTAKTTSTTNVTKSASTTKAKPTTFTQKSQKTDLRSDFITTSNKYLGYNESDGSSRVISKSGEWCADFIKFVIDETYRKKGLTPPTSDLQIEPDMPHLRVENIKQWGIRHGTYLSVANSSNKAETIRKNVKVGDVIILRENGASHTGFVTKVYNDGSFDSIEGNRNDKVMNAHYSAYDKSLSGFVQVQS